MAAPKQKPDGPKGPEQQKNYEQLRQELDGILSELQSPDLDIDKALKHYGRGLELVEELEEYLSTAENTVRELKSRLDGR